MGKIEKIIKKGLVEGQTTEIYPITSTKAIYDENNERLDKILEASQEKLTELEQGVIFDVSAVMDILLNVSITETILKSKLDYLNNIITSLQIPNAPNNTTQPTTNGIKDSFTFTFCSTLPVINCTPSTAAIITAMQV